MITIDTLYEELLKCGRGKTRWGIWFSKFGSLEVDMRRWDRIAVLNMVENLK